MRLVEIGPALAHGREADVLALLGGVPPPGEGLRPLVVEVVRANAGMVAASGAPPPWRGYLALTAAEGAVGCCAFKGAPSRGAVEIAYVTFAPFQGRGHGRAMAGRLVELARASGAVDRVVAHTRPEENPSTAILRALGFRWAGEARDPEDGLVWRWEWRPGPGPAGGRRRRDRRR